MNLVTTFCIAKGDTITYFSSTFKEKNVFKLENLYKSYLPEWTDETKIYSSLVQDLAKTSWAGTHYTYHLAGVVQTLYPEVTWAWEKQFIDIEQERRKEKYWDEYLNLKGFIKGYHDQFFDDWNWYMFY